MRNDRTVVVGPWDNPRQVVLRAGWFGAQYLVDRKLMADHCTWTEIRMTVEQMLRQQIKRDMAKVGYVPVGEALVDQTEDLMTDHTIWRMRQRAIESDSETWISIRDALAEDQGWLANQGGH